MIISALQRRGAVKLFDKDAPLEQNLLDTIIEAGRLAPSAYGLQPYRLVLITDRDRRAALAAHCYNQPQVTDAAALLIGQVWQRVTESDIEKYMMAIVQQRGVTRQELEPLYGAIAGQFLQMPEKDFFSWATHQAYISLGMMLTAAAIENVGSSPMEGFNPEQLDKALKTQQPYRSVFLLALGYRSTQDQRSRWPRVRHPKEEWVVTL